MSQSLIRIEVANVVAEVVLNRPQKRNALSRQLFDELSDGMDRIEQDSSVRVLLLKAEGPVFCAGMDLGEMQSRAARPDATELWETDTRVYRELIERLFCLALPSVAVVQGPVLAGGVGLALACDIMLAAKTAWFSLPEPKRGITAAVVTPMLTYRIGAGNAGFLLLTQRPVSAADGLRIGLCHEVVSIAYLERKTADLVASILTGAPSALAMTKNTLRRCAAENLSQQLDFAMQVSANARESTDAREGLDAFLEKRDPIWVPKPE